MPQVRATTAAATATLNALRDRLLSGQAPGGGWPYYAGRSPRIEPTAWGLLALSSLSSTPRISAALEKGWHWLASIQQPSGLLVEPGVPTANYGWNGLALIATTAVASPAADSIQAPLTRALLASRGRAFQGDRSVLAQDSTLQAWSWIENTFSWIEPTTYSLIGLKRLKTRSAEASIRISEAEAVMFDRVCEGGGWNYGNSNVLGQDLRPYVPTTALGVLALQDRPSHPAVLQSLEWLQTHALSERSSMALALVAIALDIFQRPIRPALEALSLQVPTSSLLGNLHPVAMATYALTLPASNAGGFAVIG